MAEQDEIETPSEPLETQPSDGASESSSGASASKATPTQWAAVRFPDSDSGRPHPDKFRHGAASALHGWDLHRYHTGQEIALSEADYDAALEAATTTRDGAIAPHDAALSPVLRDMIASQEGR